MKSFIKTVFFLLLGSVAYSQTIPKNNTVTGQVNAITTAAPFLMITPDSRAGGMGDAGVATSPDANSMHWNAAKYAYTEHDMGISLSYTPWLSALINDLSLSYLSGYQKIGKKRRQTVSFALLYFSLGDIMFTDINGQEIRPFQPREFSLDGAYSFMLGEHISSAIAMRIIYSNLTGGISSTTEPTRPGWAFAGDWSLYYNRDIDFLSKKSKLAFGANFSNLGSKISYSDGSEQNFIPMNMRLGTCLTTQLDDYNSLSFTLDINKLLVPTPPFYDIDTITGERVIFAGKEDQVSPPVAIFQSFNDAPGGFNEELHELTYSVGTEYWYNKQFAIRAGYFHEHATKGNRKFLTFGLGLKLNVFGLDFAYLIPTQARNPLENTLRFSLLFDFGGKRVVDEKDLKPQ